MAIYKVTCLSEQELEARFHKRIDREMEDLAKRARERLVKAIADIDDNTQRCAYSFEWMNGAFEAAAKLEVIREAMHIFKALATDQISVEFKAMSYTERLAELNKTATKEVINSVRSATSQDDPCRAMVKAGKATGWLYMMEQSREALHE